jgi:phosphatidate phosphatase PAH1
MRRNRKTIFCDIDGTLFEHKKDLHAMVTEEPCILPGVIEKFSEWRSKDYYIMLTTARPEGCRNITEKQLASFGIFYDRLVMGLPVGPRVVINDKKPDGLITSEAVCLIRDSGLLDVEI